MTDFSGRTIIVTGGAQGIGRGVVEYLIERGGSIVIADNDREAGHELLAALGESQRLMLQHTDVCSESEIKACVAATIDRFGTIDGLVNNAGIAVPGSTPIMELTLEQWNRLLATNLTSCFLTVKHCAPFLKQRRGAVVNICSTRALQSEPDTESYSASKGGLLSLTHALAISFSNEIRVNAILPGWIDVGPFRKQAARKPPIVDPREHRQHPAGRIGTPRDIGAMTAFLLGDEAGFITGQGFVVDGGMTRKMHYLE